MAELKTKQNNASVTAFLEGVADDRKRRECLAVLKLMKKITGEKPKMWGPSIVGFGSYHYKYASGHEGDCFVSGFAPRKDSLTLYIMAGFTRYDELMQRLGKHKTGKSCLYIKKLEDVDISVLGELITLSVAHVREMYPETGG